MTKPKVELYALLNTQGAVANAKQLKETCIDSKIIPLLVIRSKTVQDTPLVPFFTSQEICLRFCKRNFPKDWQFAWVTVNAYLLEQIESKGWAYQVFKYPHKLGGLDEFSIDLELIEFDQADLNYDNYNYKIRYKKA